MDTTKIDLQVPSPMSGDNGGAIAESEEVSSLNLQAKQTEVSNTKPITPKDAGWYVAVVRCNCEKRIADDIKRCFDEKKTWFEYWVPMQKVWYIDRRSQKRKSKEKVFLTTYVFCHVGASHLNDIRFRSDVFKMLTLPGHREIYRLCDKELEDYRRIVENPDLPISPCSGPLKKGQRVRIIEGNMAGLEAYVQRISGKKAIIGNEIKYINGATIEIDRSFLEVIAE